MRLFAASLLVLGVFAPACKGTAAVETSPTLPSSPAANADFAALHTQWAERRNVDRTKIQIYLDRYPNDAAAPLVKVYLAFALIDAGMAIQADGVLAALGDTPLGATRDLSVVARAKSLRLHGAPQSALELLQPLVGKIIDDADREVFLEELAYTAIAAHDDYEALAYLDAWLRGVGEEDKERVRAKTAQILESLPRPVLEQTYRSMRARGASSGYAPETQKLVSARLAQIAVESNDAALARWLVDVSGTSAAQAGGEFGLELGELASSRRGLSVVTGRTIGLLLPTRNRELRDEAADVVRGVSWALGLPSSNGKSSGFRLVTRDDGGAGGTRGALDELAGEGASVILAGFDHASADRASAWSERNGVPVLLLAPPNPARMPQKTGYLLGERTERQVAMLVDALSRKAVKSAALVVDMREDDAAARTAEGRAGVSLMPAVRCDVPLTEAGRSRFPIDAWLRAGARGWLVVGPATCARDVVRDVRRFTETAGPRDINFALTLEAGVPPSDIPSGTQVIGASAGVVPVLAPRPEDAGDPDVREFMTKLGSRPSWWTAIGRDGGVLAKAAMAQLPEDSASDPAQVAQRRALVQAALGTAKVKLWTTDDQGFGEDRVLPRTLRLATWKGTR